MLISNFLGSLAFAAWQHATLNVHEGKRPESPRLAVFFHLTAVQSWLFGRFPIWQTNGFTVVQRPLSVCTKYLYLFITYTSRGQAPVCHSKCFTWKICCPAFQRKHWEVDLEEHDVNRWNIGDICVHILRQTWILWWCFFGVKWLGIMGSAKLEIWFLGLCDKCSRFLMFKAQDVSKWWLLFGQMRCYVFQLQMLWLCAQVLYSLCPKCSPVTV